MSPLGGEGHCLDTHQKALTEVTEFGYFDVFERIRKDINQSG
jgi:hypothetical protein